MREDAFHLQPALSSTNESSPSKRSTSSSLPPPLSLTQRSPQIPTSSSPFPLLSTREHAPLIKKLTSPQPPLPGELMSWSRQAIRDQFTPTVIIGHVNEIESNSPTFLICKVYALQQWNWLLLGLHSLSITEVRSNLTYTTNVLGHHATQSQLHEMFNPVFMQFQGSTSYCGLCTLNNAYQSTVFSPALLNDITDEIGVQCH